MTRLIYVTIMYILVGKSGKQSIICIGIIPNLIGVLRILRAIRVRIIDVNVVPYIGQCMRARYLSHTHKTHAVVSGGAICLMFALGLYLHPYFVYASSGSSNESALAHA